ncbi:MAG TPA: hypothetical protein VLG41_11955 [Hydrogenophaga sp.]|uniref:hypothetical protein n=1 Tax=Hydrogenophaga sp. TaxID=1904254 RepID=UPI002C5638C2|nr:hypothetical protein [Hydrogenophaga sp.]HSX93632.1 hypothetical protein [Hydrogenophaga sp.]
MPLPDYFVWTRYGTESGEAVESILARKEQERQTSGGIFLWGIGNSVAPSVRKLLTRLKGRDPYVVFSPMLAPPRAVDVAPAEVVVWQSARGIDEQEWEMPAGTLVTSRGWSAGVSKSRHYALVCHRKEALRVNDSGDRFAIADLANFASGNPVGHSQVTAVVHRIGRSTDGPYFAAAIATLAYPYVVELSDPVKVDPATMAPARIRPAKRRMQIPLEVS